ncbi:MAG TPA: MFS transporter [Streptosporangiaceae bacterium]|nr:MFS transporter [Streptosporangiaceae bacterium]
MATAARRGGAADDGAAGGRSAGGAAEHGGPGSGGPAGGGAAGGARARAGTQPGRAALVLTCLILVAAVANLNLTVANVVLPDIGRAFDAGQTTLDMIAIAYSLGLAGSVLYLGAVGDRYGRKMLLVGGVLLSVPACLLAAYAPDAAVLVAGRLLGGVSAGMAYPTTLALITALWSGVARTQAIALWSGIGGAVTALGPMLAGLMLQHFWWGSAFLLTLPLAVLALAMAVRFVPAHVNETTGRVDNLGGVLSMIFVAALVITINFAPVPGAGPLAVGTGLLAVVAGAGFVARQRRARPPLYDLHVAGRRIFWVAALGGIIVFGALMAAIFVGQQYLQDVLGYSALGSGLAVLPAAVCLVAFAPLSARLVRTRGSRFTLLSGYTFCLLSFLTMLLLWREGSSYWVVELAFVFLGAGVGLAGTPASHSLTGSVPTRRAGMASGTADLQRDLGGAIMQSVLGALLTAGYASAVARLVAQARHRQQITGSVQNQLEKSFTGAQAVAQRYPQYTSEITAAAKSAFLAGDQWAYAAAIVAVLLGAGLVFFMFPRRVAEDRLLARYHAQDGLAADPAPGSG